MAMIELECATCHKLWTQTCEDCAEWSAGQHAKRTGHRDVRIRALTLFDQLARGRR